MNSNDQYERQISRLLKPLIIAEEINYDEIVEVAEQLNVIYENGYKNSYVFSYNLISDSISNATNPEYIPYLFIELRDEVSKDTYGHKTEMIKLVDFLQLEFARYNNLSSATDAINQQIEIINDDIKNYNDQTNDIQEDIWKFEQRMDDSTSKSVSILGIFAGVVTAFMAGFSILSGAFSSLDSEISKYRIFALFLIIGMIFYNTIVTLMFVIAKISGNDIGVMCKKGYYCDKESCNYYKDKGIFHSLICQALNKYPLIFVFDLLFLYLLYSVVMFWAFSSNNKDFFIGLFAFLNRHLYIKDIVLLFLLVIPIIVLAILKKIFLSPVRDISKSNNEQECYDETENECIDENVWQ